MNIVGARPIAAKIPKRTDCWYFKTKTPNQIQGNCIQLNKQQTRENVRDNEIAEQGKNYNTKTKT